MVSYMLTSRVLILLLCQFPLRISPEENQNSFWLLVGPLDHDRNLAVRLSQVLAMLVL